MNAKDFSEVTDPVLRGSLAAMRRAAALARKIAIETDTYIVTVKDGQIRRISAEELRRDTAIRNSE
jgi:hypothetical protein